MLPGMELMHCPNLAVPREVMHHVVQVESSFNPYAIGVVGGRLARQPTTLPEALSTARMLERRGYNFSLGLAQVNRYNLARQGLDSYERAFQPCANLQAGARILAECHGRSGGSWGRAFSCYYSGNFVTGYRHGYVQKVFASMRREAPAQDESGAIAVIGSPSRPTRRASPAAASATPIPAATASAARLRLSARIVPVPPSTTTAVESGGAASAPNAWTPPAAAAVAMVEAGGAAPRLVEPSATPAPPAAASATPATRADTAFVF